MPTFPAKINYAAGNVLTAAQMVDIGNGLNDLLPDAKGSLTTVSAANTPAQLTVGSDGSTLVADSSTTTGLRYNPQNALANPIINGGMDIAQRGTSISVAASTTNQYTLDRWTVGTSASQASTFSRQATGDTTNLPNIQYCARIQRNSGQTGTGYLDYLTNIETANTIPLAGKTVTVSFYARRGANYSPTSNALKVRFWSATNTDGNIFTSWTGSVNYFDNDVTLTTTWQRFAITATINSTAASLALAFSMIPTGTAGAADFFEVTGVQIDLGTYTASTAPTFRRSGGTLAGELAACQRYYFRSSSPTVYGPHGNGQCYASTAATILVVHPVQLRTNPSSIDFATVVVNDGAANYAVTALTIDNSTTHKTTLNASVASGLTQYRPCLLLNNNSTAGYVGLNAEL